MRFLSLLFRTGTILFLTLNFSVPLVFNSALQNIDNMIRLKDSTPSIRFAVIGDYGLAGQPALDVANRVESWNPDLIVTVGDNNYDLGAENTIDANIGQYYHNFIYPYNGSYGSGAINNKFFPTLGNHDWYTANAQPYLNYFSLPGNERYYDFVRGPVHFFMLDSDVNEPDGNTSSSVQALWLQNALSATLSPWNIVLLHHAPFSSGAHGSTAYMQWPYEDWGADVVLAGHDHVYERIINDGMLYFVNGLGGHSLYNFNAPVDGSQFRYNGDYGAMLVDATSENLNFQFVTRGGVVVDQFALTKDVALIDPGKISFQEVASGLTSPIFITNAGDGSGRVFVVEQSGIIRILKNGNLLETPFLDIHSIVKTGGEQGLLSLAFHPSYSTNGIFFVAYTAPRNGDSTGSNLVLEKFVVSVDNPDLVNPNSGVILMTISHPINSNHNGSSLAFGADGYLYWSTGDGGSGGDPLNNAQQLNNLLGKILRIDVNSGALYGIPGDNPFTASANPEIWAYGLRNPWRISFDRLTHDLYIGDVGQSVREEVDFQAAGSSGGENYGWRVMEGSGCYNPSTGCNQTGKILPVTEYSHTFGCSITGGYVYRGLNFPSFGGYYFYGDFCSGRLFGLYNDSTLGWQSIQFLDTSYSISTFGEDERGELYLADYGTGKIYNIRYRDVPIVVSSVRDLTSSNLVTVKFIVTFSQTVTGVDINDFSLTATGNLSDASIIEVVGSGGVYAVSVNTGSGNTGTIRLNIVDDDSIIDDLSSPLGGEGFSNGDFLSGETFTVNKTVNAYISDDLIGSHFVPAQTNSTQSYTDLDNGPVSISSTDGTTPIIGSLQVIWQETGERTSYAEMMGLPKTRLSSEYWFPWYNNLSTASMDQAFRFGNADTVPTTIEVSIAGQVMETYDLDPGESVRDRYAVDNGPVRVRSLNDKKIIASMRVIWQEPGQRTSYSEMMGLPKELLSTEYWFPWYNNLAVSSMDQAWRFGNADTVPTTIEVSIAGQVLQTYDLDPGESVRDRYAVDNGPVRIRSLNDKKIIAAMRVIWQEPGQRTSYSEMMGLPKELLSAEYWFPKYNNVTQTSMDQAFRFGNADTVPTTIEVSVAGEVLGSYDLDPGESVRDRYAVNDGPIRVRSLNDKKIIAAMRTIWQESGQRTSYSEIMGLPQSLLSTEYWFPWYNNKSIAAMTQSLIFGIP